MLHTFAAGTSNIYRQQGQYLVHAREHHFHYIPGLLDGIDRDAKRIHLAPMEIQGESIADARELDYDVLILAVGSRANDFGTPGVAEHCHFIDNQEQADAFNQRLRAHIIRSLARGNDINIAIVGGGATGVELTAELSRMVEMADGYGDDGDDSDNIRQRLHLTLLEGAPRILGAFPEYISTQTTNQLRALGVDVRTGVKVVGADAHGYQIAHLAGMPGPMLDYPFDTTRTAAQLVLNGVVTRHPNARIILSHAGGFLPYAAFRVAQVAALAHKDGPPSNEILEQLRSFYFDTALSSPLALPSLTAFAKPDHILFGSDFPYAPAPLARMFTAEQDGSPVLNADQHASINRGNALPLFPRLAALAR